MIITLMVIALIIMTIIILIITKLMMIRQEGEGERSRESTGERREKPCWREEIRAATLVYYKCYS